MRRLLSALLVAAPMASALPSTALAQPQQFVREYTYRASDADSRLTARTAALEACKKLLLEEVGVYIRSKLSLRKSVTTREGREIAVNEVLNEDLTALVAGVTRAKILDEQWDGATFRLKAEITVDPDDVVKRVASAAADDSLRQELVQAQRELGRGMQAMAALRDSLDQLRSRDAAQRTQLAQLQRQAATDSSRRLAEAVEANRLALQRQTASYASAARSVSASELFKRGYDAAQRGAFADAVQGYTEACEAGSAAACSNLGVLYEKGTGTGADSARAAALYRQACERGNATGCGNYGTMLEFGRGVVRDQVGAAGAYRQGCDRGYLRACFRLGLMQREGTGGLLRDSTAARLLIERACTGGYGLSCGSFATYFDRGLGVPLDSARATALLRIACDAGSGSGCTNLGLRLETGRGGAAADSAQALALYLKGCELGSSIACGNAGLMYEFGRSVPRDAVRARALYQKGCTGNHGRSCERLARVLTAGQGGPADSTEATAARARACTLGVATACPPKD